MYRKKEKGFALVLSLVLLLVMSLMGGALIVVSSGDHQSNNNSDRYQQAFYVAETGLMQGEKWVLDNYLGHWMSRLPTAEETLGSPGDDASAAERAAYEAEVDAYNDFTANYNIIDGLFRHTFAKGPARNDTEIFPENKTTCMKSFKNLRVDSNILITGGGKLPKKENFIKIVGPLLLKAECTDYKNCKDAENKDFLEEANNENYALTDQEQDKIIENEISYIRRFEYEFFVVNAGSAAYRGSGSSLATTTSNIDTQGTAYKIYACGMFFGKPNNDDDPNNGEIEILIPLEHLIVMPS
tara:strand:- start:5547 stop:6440 length:894 start_codon:yes stop_codon:yes gene_type:complete